MAHLRRRSLWALLLTLLAILPLGAALPGLTPARPGRSVRLAAGTQHTLFLNGNGSVLAWGNNDSGQCTVPEGARQGVVAVAAGSAHSLALKTDGSIVAWGDSTYCQIPQDLGPAVALAGGWDHSLALKADGTVVAWGSNTYQQCDVPTDPKLKGVVAIAAGARHSLALKADGTVVAWGWNLFGQCTVPPGLKNVVAVAAGEHHSAALLADGSVQVWGSPSQPTPTADLSGVVGLWSCDNTLLALKADGTVVAWGSNESGQLTVPSGLKDVVAAAAGHSHTVALKADGSLAAWGDPTSDKCVPPFELHAGTLAVAAGRYHIAALKANGSALVWGDNGGSLCAVPSSTMNRVRALTAGYASAEALMADGTVVAWGAPTGGVLTIPPGLKDVAAIAAGSFHMLALQADGTLLTWGDNSDGQRDVPGVLTDVIALAAGSMHSVALKADGKVVAWGIPDLGVCTVPAGALEVTTLAAGEFHTLARKADGTVVAWGDNRRGQCNVPADLKSVIAIAAGSSHSLALKADGTVVTWGDNGSGQRSVPAGLRDVIAIAAAETFSVALKADGAVVAWGGNGYGALNCPQPTLSLVSSANPCAEGDTPTLTATVTGASANPGVLALQQEGQIKFQAPPGALANFPQSPLAFGAHLYEAVYAGDPACLDARATLVQSVLKTTTTTLTLDANPAVYGTPLTLAATVTPKATGTVSFSDGGVVLGTASLDANGVATFMATNLAAGTHTLQATYAGDSLHQGFASAAQTLTVTQAPATVTLDGLAQTYTGSPCAVTATTIPAGRNLTFLYDGQTTPPTNAGSYAVLATIDEPNYSGSATGTLVISKGTATVTLGNLNLTYAGLPLAATATTVPAGIYVTFTYDGQPTPPTAAGSYTVVATAQSPNHVGSATGTLVIQKAPAILGLGDLDRTYTGSPCEATATTIPAGMNVTFTYNGQSAAPTAAGSYAVVATIQDANHIGSTTGTLVIRKAAASVTLAGLDRTYTGSPCEATAITLPAGMNVTLTYNGQSSAPTAPGSYAVVATVQDANHVGSATGILVIGKAAASVTLAGLDRTYTGSPCEATATTIPAGMNVTLTYNGQSAPPIAAGSYAVVATIQDANHIGSTTGTLVIRKAAATVTLAGLDRTYTGSPCEATATTIPAGMNVTLTYNGQSSAPSAAGSYAVVATIQDANHTGSATGTLVISKAAASVTLSGLDRTYTGSPCEATATTNPAGMNVTFTYDGQSTPPTAAGSYAVVATIQDANHTGGATGTLVIRKAAASVTLAGLDRTYTGSPCEATAITVPAGMNVTFTYDGQSTPPTAAGSYAVVATIQDANRTGSTTGTLVISKVVPVLTLSVSGGTYAGQDAILTARLTAPGAPSGVVRFMDGSSLLATVALQQGQATQVVQGLTAGLHPFSAVYEGNANLTASNSPVSSYQVSSPVITLRPVTSSMELAAGGTSSLSIGLEVLGTPQGPLSLHVSGLPAGMTAEFSEATLDPSHLPATVTLWLRTSGFHLMAQNLEGTSGRGAAFLVCGLLVAPLARRRRRTQILLGVLALVAGLFSACGGGHQAQLTQHTPPGSYALSLEVHDAQGAILGKTPLTLNVR